MTEQSHLNENNLSNLYQHLMQINQEIFADGHYSVAYHLLAAALQCARTLSDIQGLVEVERVANEQLQWIDIHHPEYVYSTQSASALGYPSIYHSLTRQARARVWIIQYAAQWRDQE